MSSPKSVPYRSLTVHTGKLPADTGTAAGAPREESHQRFADFFRRRPTAAGNSSTPAARDKNPLAPADSPAPPARRAPAPVAEDRIGGKAADAEPMPVLPRQDEPPADTAARCASPAGGVADTDRQGHQVITYIAKTVIRFCNDDGVRRSDSWQIRIALRADVLPETTLHLGLSPHWLLLRFEAYDASAKALLCRHQKSLEEMLDHAVVPRREISISFD